MYDGNINALPREELERYFNYEAYGKSVSDASTGFFGKGCYIEYTK
jgi:hypothetical protein